MITIEPDKLVPAQWHKELFPCGRDYTAEAAVIANLSQLYLDLVELAAYLLELVGAGTLQSGIEAAVSEAVARLSEGKKTSASWLYSPFSEAIAPGRNLAIRRTQKLKPK